MVQIISIDFEFSRKALTCSTRDLGIRITTVSSPPHLPQPLFLSAPNRRPLRWHPPVESLSCLSRLKFPAILPDLIVLIEVTLMKYSVIAVRGSIGEMGRSAPRKLARDDLGQ